MTGIEYEVTLAMPPQLFVIVKQNRKSPTLGKFNYQLKNKTRKLFLKIKMYIYYIQIQFTTL